MDTAQALFDLKICCDGWNIIYGFYCTVRITFYSDETNKPRKKGWVDDQAVKSLEKIFYGKVLMNKIIVFLQI